MSASKRVHAVDGLFAETPDGPRLLGSKCSGCGAAYFPKDDVCHNPACEAPAMRDVSFGPTGTLWSLAVQNYAPPPPVLTVEPYVPYAMGVIDLDDGLRVMGRIDVDDPMTVEVGADVELVVGALCADDDGNDIVSWMFRPVSPRAGGRGGRAG
jgi:uncharacterized OB-fold protein